MPGSAAAQIGEPAVAHGELAKDQQRPPIADQIEAGGDRAVLAVGALWGRWLLTIRDLVVAMSLHSV